MFSTELVIIERLNVFP